MQNIMTKMEIPKAALASGEAGDYLTADGQKVVCVAFVHGKPKVVGWYGVIPNGQTMAVLSIRVWAAHYADAPTNTIRPAIAN